MTVPRETCAVPWDKAAKRRWGKRLHALKPFDPYHSPLCTCGPKLTLNVYNGCGFECFYCYTSSYSRGRWGRDSARWSDREGVVEDLKRDIALIQSGTDAELAALRELPVVLSLSSDPYPDAPRAREEDLRVTRQCLIALTTAGFAILIQTKSDLICRDLDVLDPNRTLIGVTITTADPALAAKIEPYCPPPERRIAALRQASDRGFPTLCRIDPIIPGVNDLEQGIDALIGQLADARVRHVVSSTFKKRADSARRFAALFPQAAAASDASYDTRPVSGYHYLHESRRRELMSLVREIALRHRLSFACCREGLSRLNTGRCDGQHMLNTGAQ